MCSRLANIIHLYAQSEHNNDFGQAIGNIRPQLVQDIAQGDVRPPQPLPPRVLAAIAHLVKANRPRAAELLKLLESGQFLPPKVWPHLSLIACWTKAAASFYLTDFPKYFAETPVCDITYGASEGRGTVCLSPTEQMLAVRSHFFEFIAEDEIGNENARALTADQVELGKNYYILFTTAAGLYRYNLNDIVKIVGWHNGTPLLEFLHKGGNISSFTGEKITESQVTNAVRDAAEELALPIRFFTVIPQFRPEPHYQAWLECSGLALEKSNARLAAKAIDAIDRHLGMQNIEYRAKRDSKRLAPPAVRFLRDGTYEELRRNLVACGVPDAQVKVSHLSPKQDVIDSINALQQIK